jgi:predicted HTH transcriptional regulator
MLEVDIYKIDEAYLLSLVNTKRLEDTTLEYKQQIPGTFFDVKPSDKDKETFLKNICAFANTRGGDLIYGMAEKSNVPIDPKGLKITKEKAAEIKSRMLDIVRDCTEPPIHGIDCHPVEVKGGSRIS